MLKKTSVTGLAELRKALEGLPVKLEVDVTARAMRRGLQVTKEAAIALAPHHDGDLKKSIRIRTSAKAKKRGVVRVDVVAGDKTAFYAHMVEYGTASFYTGEGKSVRKPYIIRAKNIDGSEATTAQKRRALKVGNSFPKQVIHPGIKPTRFFTTAADMTGLQAIEDMASFYRKAIPALVKRYNKKQAKAAKP